MQKDRILLVNFFSKKNFNSVCGIMEGGGAEGVSSEKQAEAMSYTYWVREVTQDAAPLPVPRKLTSDDLSNPASNHLGSVWNRVFYFFLSFFLFFNISFYNFSKLCF